MIDKTKILNEELSKDIRLYTYGQGTLHKLGKGKTGPRPHMFSSVEAAEADVKKRIDNHEGRYGRDYTQYVIVEYTESDTGNRSKIVKIIGEG